MSNIRKTIICIIQDYCNCRGYIIDCDLFALSFGRQCEEMLENSILTVDSCKKALIKYKDFLHNNSLTLESFAIELVSEISRNCDYFPPTPELYQSILSFKAYIEGNISDAFKVARNPREETGRCLLQTYLIPRGFREAQMSGGRCDLVLPSEKIIIETKIWHDTERFYDGIEELCAYLDSQGYKVGYYILFDNTQGTNTIVLQNGSDVFSLNHNGHTLHCFFIMINPVAPSRRRQSSKH